MNKRKVRNRESIIFPGVVIGPTGIWWRISSGEEFWEDRGGENEKLLLWVAVREIEHEAVADVR